MAELGLDLVLDDYMHIDENGEPISAYDELRQHTAWVSYKLGAPRTPGGKPTKLPINPKTGRTASSTNSDEWGTYAEAKARTRSQQLAGIGYVFTADDGYTAIDIDHCRDPETGEFEPWVAEVLSYEETYAEVSPSGAGVHLIARGKLEKPITCNEAQVEMYITGRYFTMTESRIDGSPTSIMSAPKTIEALLARVAAVKPALVVPVTPTPPSVLPRPVRPSNVAALPPASSGSFFRNVNDAALANLDAWVPAVFPSARTQASTGGYRIKSKDLGRDLQEDLGITPNGIWDFGLERSSTAVTVIMDFGGAADAITAARWLCTQMGTNPKSLGHKCEDSAPINMMAEGLLAGTDSVDAALAAWNSPDLSVLSNGRRLAPEFDAGWLGSGLKSWAELQAKGASAPLDYVCVSMLSLAAAVLGNSRWPQAGAGWWEPPILWCSLVGSPSSGKSPAMGGVTGLLEEAERLMAQNHEQQLSDFAAKKIMAVTARERWEANVRLCEKDNAKGGIPDLPADAKEPNEPICPRIKVGDATTEKLGLMSAGMPNGLLLVRDELDGWYTSFGRYGSGGADRAFALEMYGGRSYSIERVKHPEPIRIDHLSIGVLGGIQPDKVTAILKSVDDGLVARFLWCFPEPLPTFSISRDSVPTALARTVITRLSPG